MRTLAAAIAAVLGAAVVVSAAATGTLRGVVHDPQHRPVPGATIVIAAVRSEWRQTLVSDGAGEFIAKEVPIGDYTVTVSLSGFTTASQHVTVTSGASPVLHVILELGNISQTVVVSGTASAEAGRTVTPTTLVSRADVRRTPGADQTNSLKALTAFVPGAYLVHDQLHVQGGHQVSWLIDGVPVPNTNIASNVGPQLDPKDLDYLEVQRGGYDAGVGDRTYGVFNVSPRTGFEATRQSEVTVNAGNFSQAAAHVSFASHTDRLAYYASVGGTRTDLGLDPPTAEVLHDRATGGGAFGSVIFNVNAENQLRVIGSARRDTYQIPNTAEDQAAGRDDLDREGDGFLNGSWVRTFSSRAVLTVAPFYHTNRADYVGGSRPDEVTASVERRSTYVGAQVSASLAHGPHDISLGFYGFHQHDRQGIDVRPADTGGDPLSVVSTPTGHTEALFVQDRVAIAPWFTLSAGLRGTFFSGGVSESVASPRVGAWAQLPRGVVVRASYGRYYQEPPLQTATGPLLDFVTDESLGIIPLHGERDEEVQAGATIPASGWSIDLGAFHTRATNFFDHNSIGESNVFLPLTIEHAYISGADVSVRSPRVWRRGQVHLSYAWQRAQGEGGISGGLTNFEPPEEGRYPLDHDQRHTLSVGFDADVTGRMVTSANVYYGSGFVDGEGPDHLPGHTQVDASLGWRVTPDATLSVTALNLFNESVLVDNSETFGGTHWSRPREVYVALHVRFQY
jgi:outer membrane receptor protein involved in Fe transport